ncbi:hypothetical protein AAHA92_24914 [Salvia divinorum]|uniref:Uncharacterized protein n=1 Tax=Salvia divinorum TaxID=28513 RepID=A0ABD1GC10_SALDI
MLACTTVSIELLCYRLIIFHVDRSNGQKFGIVGYTMVEIQRPDKIRNVNGGSEGTNDRPVRKFKKGIDRVEYGVYMDNNAKFMRNKPWPFWEAWQCIFGKDRAIGGGAENVDAATTRVCAQLGGGSQCNESAYHPTCEDSSTNDETNPVVEDP